MAEPIAIELPTELTPALRDLLGFMCFQVGQFIGADGEPLKKRAEDEQAFMLHRFLVHWAKAGDQWRTSMAQEMAEVVAIAKEKAAGE